MSNDAVGMAFEWMALSDSDHMAAQTLMRIVPHLSVWHSYRAALEAITAVGVADEWSAVPQRRLVKWIDSFADRFPVLAPLHPSSLTLTLYGLSVENLDLEYGVNPHHVFHEADAAMALGWAEAIQETCRAVYRDILRQRYHQQDAE